MSAGRERGDESAGREWAAFKGQVQGTRSRRWAGERSEGEKAVRRSMGNISNQERVAVSE